MPILVICGQDGSGWSLAHSVLALAGLPAANLFREGTFAPEELTKRICNACKVGKDGAYAQIIPGQVWQALSVDMVLANLEQENWGWADPNSIYLLDHWRDLDPRFNFILMYSSPEYHLAQILKHEDPSSQATEKALRKWQVYNEELLRFHGLNRARVLLVNVETLLEKPSHFLSVCGERLKLDLNQIDTQFVPNDQKVPAFALMYASSFLKEVPEAQLFFEKLESAADLPRAARPDREVILRRAWGEHQEMSSRSVVLSARNAELTVERDERRHAHDLLLGQLREMQKKLEHTVERLQALEGAVGRSSDACQRLTEQNEELQRTVATLRADKQRLEVDVAAGATSVVDAKKENGLLLIQLHQVQKELQQTFLEGQNKDDEFRALQGKHKGDANSFHQLTEQHQKLQQTVATLRADKQRLEVDVAAGATSVVDAKKENGLLLIQLHQVQEELERTFLERRKKDDEFRTLQVKYNGDTGSLHQLTEQNQKLQQTVATLRADKQRLEVDVAAGATSVVDAKKENGLLLIQLHQVQQELNHYFLKYQALEKKNKEQPPAGMVTATIQPSVPSPAKSIRAEAIVDMRSFIDGENWHSAENDGRWAGPGRVSVLRLPKVPQGRYRLELDIVDAITPEIIKEMAVSVDGKQMQMKRIANTRIAGLLGPLKRIYITHYKRRYIYPLSLVGEVEVGEGLMQPRLTLTFPNTQSPEAILGAPDSRALAIRVRQVRLSPC